MGLKSGAGYLLGLDAGGTFTKAVIFSEDGRQVAVGRGEIAVSSPHPVWQERDMNQVWEASATAIRQAISAAGISGSMIKGVGLAGHNDGAYLIDQAGKPVRPGIMATDTRARAQAQRLADGGSGASALQETGQVPAPYSPSAILNWLKENEPESLRKADAYLFCKDWLRFRLTGRVATDPTEASASFTNLSTQSWSAAALEIFDLKEYAHLLPEILPSSEIAGHITEEAAQQTGLMAGTPVVTGAHDVDTAAVGIGAIKPGTLSMIMGTFSINQVVGTAPVVDVRWQARSFIEAGQWLHMSTSPSSASNFEWAVRRFAGVGQPLSYDTEITAARLGDPKSFEQSPLFLPFLYGAPLGYGAEGGMMAGLRGSHDRSDLMRAVLEGVVYNHLGHVNALREKHHIDRAARLCGGGANNADWSQFVADALDLEVEVTDASEAGARGAAVLAGIGIGMYSSLSEAVTSTVRVKHRYTPNPKMRQIIDERYAKYQKLAELSNQL